MTKEKFQNTRTISFLPQCNIIFSNKDYRAYPLLPGYWFPIRLECNRNFLFGKYEICFMLKVSQLSCVELNAKSTTIKMCFFFQVKHFFVRQYYHQEKSTTHPCIYKGKSCWWKIKFKLYCAWKIVFCQFYFVERILFSWRLWWG